MEDLAALITDFLTDICGVTCALLKQAMAKDLLATILSAIVVQVLQTTGSMRGGGSFR